MGWSSRSNNTPNQLQQQYQQSLAQSNALLASLAKPSELQTRLEQEDLNFLDDTSGKNGPMDIYKVRGMEPYLDLYNHAKEGQTQERFGEGALTLAGDGSSGWGKLMKEHRAAQREQDAAGQLSNAFAVKNAEVRGSALPLINAGINRASSAAGVASNNAGQAGNIWMNYRQTQRPSFWSQLLGGIQGVAQGAASNPAVMAAI